MDQNFTVLYSQSGERYCSGAPLLIADSAVLRSETSGELFGRVKFRNMDERVVQVVQYRVQPLDAANRPLGASFVQRQMDLSAGWESEFGSELLFLLPDPFTRGLKVEIVEVIFADASLWEAPEEASWEAIPAPKPLLKTLGDPELLDLLQQEKGPRCWALPVRYEGFWRCSCGHLTEDRFSCCPKCGQSYFEPDVAALTAVRDQRLQEEKEAWAQAEAYAAEQARIAAEQKAAARKKAKKVRRILLLTVLPALLITAIALLGIPGFYTLQAKSAAKSGDYVTAVEKYESAARFGLFDRLFQVSGEQARLTPASHYQRGEEALAAGDYAGALAAFAEAGNYSDAAQRIPDVYYRQGEAAAAAGDYAQAVEAFKEAGDYEDADQRILDVYYRQGEAALAAGDYAQAVEAFKEAGDYKDAADKLKQGMLCLADQACAAGDYRTAYELYLAADEQPEDKEVWYACCLGALKSYVDEGDLDTALKVLKKVRSSETKAAMYAYLGRGYVDAGDYMRALSYLPLVSSSDPDTLSIQRDAYYRAGIGLYEQGKYSSAETCFLSDFGASYTSEPSDYMDSLRYWQLCQIEQMKQKLDEGDYSRALIYGGKVDPATLSDEESAAFADTLYQYAAAAKRNGSYASAFSLYEMSRKDNYLQKMEECNQAYIREPKSFYDHPMYEAAIVFSHTGGSACEITDALWLYSGGTLTVTLQFRTTRDLEYYIIRWEDGDGYGYTYANGSVKKDASSLSLDFPVSAAKGYNSIEFFLEYNSGNYWYVESLYLESLFFETVDLDLYGNKIP